MDRTIALWLERRPEPAPAGFVDARLERERRKEEWLASHDAHPLRRRSSPHWMVPRALALAGLASRARRNALRIEPTRHALLVRDLPEAFVGFRVLQVSDPHFGADPALDEAILASVVGVEHELCVMTGDYRYLSFGPIERAVACMERLAIALGGRGQPLAVLGNHDPIAIGPPLEAAGIRVLLNESVTLRRGSSALHVVGVDDPRYYRLDDLGKALAAREPAPDAATLLLAHSPEIAGTAAAAGCGAYLCGHTHGGQVCLPGRRVIMRNSRAPLEHLSGGWRLGGMSGYTSRGAGVSIAVARFNCSAEITLHVLERAPDGM